MNLRFNIRLIHNYEIADKWFRHDIISKEMRKVLKTIISKNSLKYTNDLILSSYDDKKKLHVKKLYTDDTIDKHIILEQCGVETFGKKEIIKIAKELKTEMNPFIDTSTNVEIFSTV